MVFTPVGLFFTSVLLILDDTSEESDFEKDFEESNNSRDYVSVCNCVCAVSSFIRSNVKMNYLFTEMQLT